MPRSDDVTLDMPIDQSVTVPARYAMPACTALQNALQRTYGQHQKSDRTVGRVATPGGLIRQSSVKLLNGRQNVFEVTVNTQPILSPDGRTRVHESGEPRVIDV